MTTNYIKDPYFLKCFDFTIKNEGGYNEIRFDNGGATNYGVSLRFLKDLYENGTIWVDLNNDGKIDSKDIQKLSLDNARKLYYINFYVPLKISALKNETLGIKLFDTAVNVGNRPAIRFLQSAISKSKPITIDGLIGPQTINEANKADTSILNLFIEEQKKYYNRIVEKNPTQQKFIKGWHNRANKLP